MKTFQILSLGLLFLLINFYQCFTQDFRSETETKYRPRAPRIKDWELPAFRRTMNDFARKLYMNVSAYEPNKNIVISPVYLFQYMLFFTLGLKGEAKDILISYLEMNSTTFKRALQYGQRIYDETTSFFHSRQFEGVVWNGMAHSWFVYQPEENFEYAVEHFFIPWNWNVTDDFNPNDLNKRIEEITEKCYIGIFPNKRIKTANNIAALLHVFFVAFNYTNPPEIEESFFDDFYDYGVKPIFTFYMFMEGYYNFAVLPELGATALEIPYKTGVGNWVSARLVIVLPNDPLGLAEVERKLMTESVYEHYVKKKMEKVWAFIEIPFYDIEHTLDLQNIMRKAGLDILFENGFDYSPMFQKNAHLYRHGDARFDEMRFNNLLSIREDYYSQATLSYFNTKAKRFYNVAPKEEKKKPRTKREIEVEFVVKHPYMMLVYVDELLWYMARCYEIPWF